MSNDKNSHKNLEIADTITKKLNISICKSLRTLKPSFACRNVTMVLILHPVLSS